MYIKLNSTHLTQFSSQFFSLHLFQLGNVRHGFWAQDIASPGAAELIISLVIGTDSLYQLGQSTIVLRVNLGKGNADTDFPVHQTSQPGLPLDDGLGNPHLQDTGQTGRQPDEGTACHMQSPLSEPSCSSPG